MFKLRLREPLIFDGSNAVPLVLKGGEIRFENVYFSYPTTTTTPTAATPTTAASSNINNNNNALSSSSTNDTAKVASVSPHSNVLREILSGVNLYIPAGSTVAVVGSSGSGKTTLLRLLYRFYDTTSGGIYIDNQRISDVTLDSLRRSISVVPQDTCLFNDTLRYNIAYGNITRSITDPSAVETVAKQAQLDKLVARLPLGYDTIVGERGQNYDHPYTIATTHHMNTLYYTNNIRYNHTYLHVYICAYMYRSKIEWRGEAASGHSKMSAQRRAYRHLR